MTTREILIAGRALVAARWRQGQAPDVPESHGWCPLTAIRQVAGHQVPLAVEALYEALPRAAQRQPDSFPILHRAYYVARWNDWHTRTQGDALRLFDRAIAALEAP